MHLAGKEDEKTLILLTQPIIQIPKLFKVLLLVRATDQPTENFWRIQWKMLSKIEIFKWETHERAVIVVVIIVLVAVVVIIGLKTIDTSRKSNDGKSNTVHILFSHHLLFLLHAREFIRFKDQFLPVKCKLYAFGFYCVFAKKGVKRSKLI